jgi:hypothetical protein
VSVGGKDGVNVGAEIDGGGAAQALRMDVASTSRSRVGFIRHLGKLLIGCRPL